MTVPAGYETEGYYIPAKKGKHEGYDFTLTKSDIAPGEAHSFLQISDTEIGEDGVGDISTALSAGKLGLSQQTYDCIDQIQFMAYDGNDQDGYQSSLEQAEEGLREFKANGADITKSTSALPPMAYLLTARPFGQPGGICPMQIIITANITPLQTPTKYTRAPSAPLPLQATKQNTPC